MLFTVFTILLVDAVKEIPLPLPYPEPVLRPTFDSLSDMLPRPSFFLFVEFDAAIYAVVTSRSFDPSSRLYADDFLRRFRGSEFEPPLAEADDGLILESEVESDSSLSSSGVKPTGWPLETGLCLDMLDVLLLPLSKDDDVVVIVIMDARLVLLLLDDNGREGVGGESEVY